MLEVKPPIVAVPAGIEPWPDQPYCGTGRAKTEGTITAMLKRAKDDIVVRRTEVILLNESIDESRDAVI